MSNSPEKEQIIAQRYRILGTLGEGGTGTTYQAQDLETSQEVALKALSLQRMNDWKVMELFEREARVLAQLNHPGIPKYLDYFHVDTPQDRSFYITQQLAPGASLATLVQNGWRANEEEVRRIAISILEILLYLHELTPPVIHRDIKPQNIIRNSDGQIFLVDFGAVQDTYHSTFMRGSTVVGTYGYMAPEQFRGQAVPTTDLYGLGATLLFLLTHRSPADLPTDRLKIDFRSRIQVSEEFADWLEKMLEPDVEDRFLSAKEALLVLRGKRMMRRKSKSSVPWKAIVGVGVGVFILVSVVNSYKYAIFNRFGLTDFVHSSIGEGSIKIGDYLSKGGDINDKDSKGWSLLHQAVQKNKPDIVELLIDKGIDINGKDNEGKTPLHRVSSQEVAEKLIAKGADINAEDNTGATPLSVAFRNSDIDVTSLLITRGARLSNQEVKAKDDQGITLLHLVINNKNNQSAKLLIAKGADINAKDNNGNTPLCNVAERGNKEVAQLLITKGADVNVKDNYGDTPLLKAASSNKEVAQLLIAEGADINVKSNGGYTPLLRAVEYNNNELAKLLIAKGADINVKSDYGYTYGYTPLLRAVQNNNNEIAKLLIAKGADVNANKNGYTPLDWAVKNNNEEMVELLKSHGAKR
ncbi:MAG TPA: ankryin [Cyanobacteria bacterium UBA11370]|nr:ankryin [Cyanobacteria bacterium UBA11370]